MLHPFTPIHRSKDTDSTRTHEGIATEAAARHQQGKELFSTKGSSENAGAIKMQVSSINYINFVNIFM